jgi:thiol-disulfide isomerase/thioredoxin
MNGKPKIGIVGQAAPELGLDHWIGPDGAPLDPVRLADLRGKVVYMLFWQSWCPGCHQVALPMLERISRRFARDERIAFLAVQTVFEGFESNTEDKVLETQRRYNLKLPMAHDGGTESEPSRVMKDYRTGGTPWAVIVDKDGVVRLNGFLMLEAQVVSHLESLMKQVPPIC